MQQLEIQYFYPLTEQIPLDLDYTKTHEYEQETRQKYLSGSTITLSSYNGTTSAITLTTNAIDWNNSTRLGNWEIESGEKKPNKLQKFFMKYIFGMKCMGK